VPKGWYFDRMRHQMASKGIRSGCNQYSFNSDYKKPNNVVFFDIKDGYILEGNNTKIFYDEFIARQQIGLLPEYVKIKLYKNGLLYITFPNIKDDKIMFEHLFMDFEIKLKFRGLED